MNLSSTKPYLIRALFDWCVDNGLTPHVVVAVDANTKVPIAFVRDGRIVLNIAPYATHQLAITNDEITCQARFGGVAQSLVVPIANVVAVYARESGQGMAFELGEQSGAAVELGGVTEPDLGDDVEVEDADHVEIDTIPLHSVPSESPDTDQPSPDKPNGRGHLRVIK